MQTCRIQEKASAPGIEIPGENAVQLDEHVMEKIYGDSHRKNPVMLSDYLAFLDNCLDLDAISKYY